MPVIEVIRTDDDYEIADKQARKTSTEALNKADNLETNTEISNIEFMRGCL